MPKETDSSVSSTSTDTDVDSTSSESSSSDDSSATTSTGTTTTTTTTTTTATTATGRGASSRGPQQPPYQTHFASAHPQPPTPASKKVSFVQGSAQDLHPSSQATPIYAGNTISGGPQRPANQFLPPQAMQQQYPQPQVGDDSSTSDESDTTTGTTATDTTTGTGTTATTTTTTGTGRTGTTSGTTASTSATSRTTTATTTTTTTTPPATASASGGGRQRPSAPRVAGGRASKSSGSASSSSTESDDDDDDDDDDDETSTTVTTKTATSSAHSTPAKKASVELTRRVSAPAAAAATATATARRSEAVSQSTSSTSSGDGSTTTSTTTATNTATKAAFATSAAAPTAPASSRRQKEQRKGADGQNVALTIPKPPPPLAAPAEERGPSESTAVPPVITPVGDAEAAAAAPTTTASKPDSPASTTRKSSSHKSGGMDVPPSGGDVDVAAISGKPREADGREDLGVRSRKSSATAAQLVIQPPADPQQQPISPTTENAPQPINARYGNASGAPASSRASSSTYEGSVSISDDDSAPNAPLVPQAGMPPVEESKFEENRQSSEFVDRPAEAVPAVPEYLIVSDRSERNNVLLQLALQCGVEKDAVAVSRMQVKAMLSAIGVSEGDVISELGTASSVPLVETLARCEKHATLLARDRLAAAFEEREITAGEISTDDCIDIVCALGIANSSVAAGQLMVALTAQRPRDLLVEVRGVNGAAQPMSFNLSHGDLRITKRENEVFCNGQAVSSLPDVSEDVVAALQLCMYYKSLIHSFTIEDGLVVDYYALMQSVLQQAPQPIAASSTQASGSISLMLHRAIAALCRPLEKAQRHQAFPRERPQPYLLSSTVQKRAGALCPPAASAPHALPSVAADGQKYVTVPRDVPATKSSCDVPDFLQLTLEQICVPGEVVPDGARRFVLVSIISESGKARSPLRLEAGLSADDDPASPWFVKPGLIADAPAGIFACGLAPQDIIYIEICYEAESPAGRQGEGAGGSAWLPHCLAFATLPVSKAEPGLSSLWVCGGTFTDRRAIAHPEVAPSCFCFAGPPVSRIEVEISFAEPEDFKPEAFPPQFLCFLRHLPVIGAFRGAVSYIANANYANSIYSTNLDPGVAAGVELLASAPSADVFAALWRSKWDHYTPDVREDQHVTSHDICRLARDIKCVLPLVKDAEEALGVLKDQLPLRGWDAAHAATAIAQ